ncbi:MAG: hypothetical protein EOP08_07000 [Proteobacteria bacterium]|nr:MAG: hypothetical protein EOP08_07000 [Pseudomonadota bacterium]
MGFFEAPTTEQLEKLKETHGDDMLVIDYDGHTIVCALPDSDEKVNAYYKRFMSLNDDGKREEAAKSIFPALMVYPTKDEIERMVKRRPGLVRFVGMAASDLLGITVANVKKA